jgi:hypothetical protein
MGHTVAAQLLIPVVLALVCTVLTACCQLGSAPVTTISRCALHLLSEWEEEKRQAVIDHVELIKVKPAQYKTHRNSFCNL